MDIDKLVNIPKLFQTDGAFTSSQHQTLSRDSKALLYIEIANGEPIAIITFKFNFNFK